MFVIHEVVGLLEEREVLAIEFIFDWHLTWKAKQFIKFLRQQGSALWTTHGMPYNLLCSIHVECMATTP
jgi:hypothetical protein